MDGTDHAHSGKASAVRSADEVVAVKRGTLINLATALRNPDCSGAVHDALLAIADIWPAAAPTETASDPGGAIAAPEDWRLE